MRRRWRAILPYLSIIVPLIVAACISWHPTKVNDRISELTGRLWKIWIIMIETIVRRIKARLQMQIFGRVIIRELLGIILRAKAPREAIVQPLANPIELIRVVGIRAIVYCKQVAIRRERHIVGVASAAGENQPLRRESGLIIRQNQFGGAGGET